MKTPPGTNSAASASVQAGESEAGAAAETVAFAPEMEYTKMYFYSLEKNAEKEETDPCPSSIHG